MTHLIIAVSVLAFAEVITLTAFQNLKLFGQMTPSSVI